MRSENELLAFSDIPIVILCGGKSSRMGENKTFLPFGECNSLIEFQYRRLNQHFNTVFISSKTAAFDFLQSQNSKILLDDNQTLYSPLIALKSILTQVTTSKVFILTVDTPFVNIKSIEKLINASLKHEITVASTPLKVHNLCGVFSTSLIQSIDIMLKEDIHKIGYLIKQSSSQTVEFNDEDEFLNMNTPSEYLQALNITRSYIK